MTQDEIIEMAKQAGFVKKDAMFRPAYIANIKDVETFAKLIAQHERKACAEIADRLPRIYRETKDAHERLSPEPFKPSNFGFDLAVLQQAEKITHSIKARGQA